MPVLTRTWQMLLKGLAETQAAPSPLAAAEMLMVRLAYAAELPSPASWSRSLKDGAAPLRRRRRAAARQRPSARSPGRRRAVPAPAAVSPRRGASPSRRRCRMPIPAPTAQAALPEPQTFEEVVALFASEARGHPARPAAQQRASGALRAGPHRDPRAATAPRDFAVAADGAARALDRPALGRGADPTRRGRRPWPSSRPQRIAQQKAQAAQHPLVAAVLAAFPGVRDRGGARRQGPARCRRRRSRLRLGRDDQTQRIR